MLIAEISQFPFNKIYEIRCRVKGKYSGRIPRGGGGGACDKEKEINPFHAKMFKDERKFLPI